MRRLISSARRSYTPRMAGLAVIVVVWWLLLAGTVALTTPAPVASATPTPGRSVGQTTHIHEPGMPSWPIPVERAAFDEWQRGVREGDEDAMDHAFAAYEWIQASHGETVQIVVEDSEAIQVEFLDGPNSGRRAWLKARNLEPPASTRRP